MGVIPINIKDGVYITQGLGNEEYLESSSHGAGRIFSRSAARKAFGETELNDIQSKVVTNMTISMIDEAPGAYKDGDYVISHQDGIVVKVVDKTEPLFVVKG